MRCQDGFFFMVNRVRLWKQSALMMHFSLFFLLSGWWINSSVLSLLQAYLCKSAGREGGNILCNYRDEKQIVQCGHIHSVSAICKNVVHGTETSFTLGCGHWECGESEKKSMGVAADLERRQR